MLLSRLPTTHFPQNLDMSNQAEIDSAGKLLTNIHNVVHVS